MVDGPYTTPATTTHSEKPYSSGRICGIDVFAILFTLLGLSLGGALVEIKYAMKHDIWIHVLSWVVLGVIAVQLIIFCVREKIGYAVLGGLWFIQLGVFIALLTFLVISVIRDDGRTRHLKLHEKIVLLGEHIFNILLTLTVGVLYKLAYNYDTQ